VEGSPLRGRGEFYFYGKAKNGFRHAVEAALIGFEGHRFDVGQQEDSLWHQYLNVLYPSPENFPRIANMDILDVLVEKGDVLTVAREVRHWRCFCSEPSGALLRDAAAAEGFRIVSESNFKGELPFGISVGRVQPIEQRSIDHTASMGNTTVGKRQ
jgi:uncharacterized protein DUF695